MVVPGQSTEPCIRTTDELLQYLSEYYVQLASLLTDETWLAKLAKLAYLIDIFSTLNAPNLSLQGPETNILKSHDKIAAFKKKWHKQNKHYSSRINDSIFDMFPTLSPYFSSTASLDRFSHYFRKKSSSVHGTLF